LSRERAARGYLKPLNTKGRSFAAVAPRGDEDAEAQQRRDAVAKAFTSILARGFLLSGASRTNLRYTLAVTAGHCLRSRPDERMT
jgi:hypothetical protein